MGKMKKILFYPDEYFCAHHRPWKFLRTQKTETVGPNLSSLKSSNSSVSIYFVALSCKLGSISPGLDINFLFLMLEGLLVRRTFGILRPRKIESIGFRMLDSITLKGRFPILEKSTQNNISQLSKWWNEWQIRYFCLAWHYFTLWVIRGSAPTNKK